MYCVDVVAAIILSVVAFVAGHPTAVSCDPALGGHAVPGATGWTYTGGNVVYVVPAVCDETNAKIGTVQFADGLATMIHEAARARGFSRDSCVEMLADIGVFDVLRRFYAVPFFSPLSVAVGAQVLTLTRGRPSRYQPELCWQTGTIS